MAMQKLATKILSVRPVGKFSHIVRLTPASGRSFPSYRAGQHATFVRETDGTEKTFSIASSPSETNTLGYLEFYVTADVTAHGQKSNEYYFDIVSWQTLYVLENIGGTFTLQDRAEGYHHIVMVATGTGLAPFRSMIRELSDRAEADHPSNTKVTLLHSNRRLEDLAYIDELWMIEKARSIDFLYLPSITKPIDVPVTKTVLNSGRVGDMLRDVLAGGESSLHQAGNVRFLSPDIRDQFAERMKNGDMMMMVCGNPAMTEEVRSIAAAHRIPCVSENW